jgi:uncharacterized protein YbjT (DUF2867 family)
LLVNRLIATGVQIKLFVRNKQRIKHLQSYTNIESCDLELIESNRRLLADELADVDVAYYLIHSMYEGAHNGFEQTDLEIAKVVSESAHVADVGQIIYLGGLGVETPEHPLSPHLTNRQQVGDYLRQSGVSVTEIRAGIIIGAGSASFEIIRALGKKLPFLPILKNINGKCHPIDIDDVIAYLIRAAGYEPYLGRTIEIGMKRAYSYYDLVRIYARVVESRSIKRVDPGWLGAVLTKKMLARIVTYLSAVPYALAKPLLDGVDSYAIKQNYAVEQIDDGIEPVELEASFTKAARYENEGNVESYWSLPKPLQVLAKEAERFLYVNPHEEKNLRKERLKEKGLLYEIRERYIDASEVEAVFEEIKKIGGDHGYWSPQWMWSIRAFIDKLLGGPGLEVGRRDRQKSIRIGQRLDFWIVSAFLDSDERKVLTLKGRLRSPGDSWLQYVIIKDNERWKLTVRAYFQPRGIGGYLYWYSLFFIHKYIFTVMIDNIIENAMGKV